MGEADGVGGLADVVPIRVAETSDGATVRARKHRLDRDRAEPDSSRWLTRPQANPVGYVVPGFDDAPMIGEIASPPTQRGAWTR